MKAAAILVCGLSTGACASGPAHRVASTPPLPAAVVETRLAEADSLADRGCYLCLRDADAQYDSLLSVASSPTIVRKALDNKLMLAIREAELGLPDAGARAAAERLSREVAIDSDDYFRALEFIAHPPMIGGGGLDEYRHQSNEREALLTHFEAAWPTSTVGAYYFSALALSAGHAGTLKPQIDSIVGAHPRNASIAYRLQGAPPNPDADAAARLLASEPRFGEVHYALALQALYRAALVSAYEQMALAYKTLPDSLAIASSFGGLELAFHRYTRALELFDQVLARGKDDAAGIGRAIALSYLKRHRDAIAALDALLADVSNRPGEKYYWRGWNHLQLSESQPAYDDAKAALNSMANPQAFNLAGIAAYSLGRLDESRRYFESAVSMNRAECDSLRYLGLLDAAERTWPAAVDRFRSAAGCYQQAIDALTKELAEKQADASGLYADQAAGIAADLGEARGLLETCKHNVEVAEKNGGSR